MNTIWFIPISVLIGAALFIVFINRGRPNIGAAWLAAIIAALFAWGWTVSLYWRFDFLTGGAALLSRGLTLFSPVPAAGLSGGVPVFILDRISYPYMLAVVSLPLRYMHTPLELGSITDMKLLGALLAEFAVDPGEEVLSC